MVMQQCISSLALNVEALRKRKVNPRAKKLYLFAAKTHGNQTKKTNPKKNPCDTSILFFWSIAARIITIVAVIVPQA